MKDEAEAQFYVEGTNPPSYVISDQDIPLEKARLVDGALVTQDRLRSLDDQWNHIRGERNGRLRASDWTDVASAPDRLGQQVYTQWQVYRQALRDITSQSDPFNISWPTPPGTT